MRLSLTLRCCAASQKRWPAMQAAIDTDFFCKFLAWELLDDFLDLIPCERASCVRLTALPFMLRKGRLHKLYGSARAEQMEKIAQQFPSAPRPSDHWIDLLTQLDPP